MATRRDLARLTMLRGYNGHRGPGSGNWRKTDLLVRTLGGFRRRNGGRTSSTLIGKLKQGGK